MDCLPKLPLKKRARPPLEDDDSDLADALSPGTDGEATTVAASAPKGHARSAGTSMEVDVELEAVVDEEGPPTPVYGGTSSAEVVDVIEGDLSEDEGEDDAAVTTEELEGHWVVLSNGTVQIGTVDVSFPSSEEEERGIARFRDVVTQLHNKHHMMHDPDTVLGCGPEDQVKTAPPGRPMVILEPDFATSGKFWRVSRDKGVLVWHKTSLLKLEDGIGWYREAHRDDVTIRNKGFLAWTRELPEDARVVSAKELEPPRKRRWGSRITHKKRSKNQSAGNWRVR